MNFPSSNSFTPALLSALTSRFVACARRKGPPSVVVGGLLAFAASASAQTVETENAQALDPLVVLGRSVNLLGTAGAASEGSVGRRELEARPFLRRGELLEVIPGVVITQHSGGGKANQYFLRGFNLDHGTDFAVSVDGMPVNMRSHAHGQGYADLNFLIPELVAGVDYRKGPFFAEVGDFSAAGAAEFRLMDELPSGFSKVEAGGNGYGRLVVADTLRRGAGPATTLGFEVTQDDGPWELAEDFKRYSGMARTVWTREENRFAVTALGYKAEWTSTDQIPLRAVEAGELGRFGVVDPSDGGEAERASLSVDWITKSAEATNRLNAYALYNRLNLFSNFTYFLDDEENGDQFNQREKRLVVGGAFTREWSGDWSGRKVETAVGVQTRADLMSELALHRTAQRVRIGTTRDDEVSELSAGVFATSTVHWREWLRTTTGLRADGFRFDVESDNALNSGERDASIVSPKLAIVAGPWSKTEVYLNAGYGFHSNDARGVTIAVDPVSGDVAERVNPLVRSKGVELGLRTSALPGLVSTVALWALELDSELVFVGDAGGTEASGATRRAGVEWANFYQATSWLSLDVDVSLTHGRYRNAGVGASGAKEDRIANSLSRVITGGVAAELGKGWSGAVRVRHFGAQPLIEDGSVEAPSSTTVNALLAWKSSGAKSWEVAVEVLNVFDRENYDIAYFYESRLALEPSGVATGDIHFHPAEPLTVRLSVARRF